MSIPATAPRNDYTGTGVLATYDYNFRIYDATDLRVTKRDTANVETMLVYLTDYTVTGVGNVAGGTITLLAGNLPSGYKLTIRFDRVMKQVTDFRNQGGFLPEVHEDTFDILARYCQQLADVIARSLHLPETEVGTAVAVTLPVAEARASQFLAFDASGNPMAASGVADAPVSPYMATVLDDTTAAQAAATLAVLPLAGGNMTGGINEVKTTVASATTPDIWTGTGNVIDYTGTTTATGFAAAPQAGARRTLICAAAAPFTHGANFLLPGSANYTAAAGDRIEVVAITTTQFRMTILKADGTAVVSGLSKYAVIADQKASGTQGGTFTSGSWATRDLNTEVFDPDGIVAISSNHFTLAAGTYRIWWAAPASGVDSHQTRLQNTTDASTVAVGSAAFDNAVNVYSNGWSIGEARVTIAGNKDFEIQHQCQTTNATDGYGVAQMGFSVNEQYTIVRITKE